jgi:CRISPR-associated CXXC_CXXC protein Cst1
MRYSLIGSFQYDLGIYGLKKILDFFEEDYTTDGNFYIEVDKEPEQILELVILRLVYLQYLKEPKYFLDKIIDEFSKNEKNENKKIKEKFEESNEYISDKLRKYKEKFDKLIKEQKSLKKVLEEGDNLSDFIFNIFQEVLGEKAYYRKEDVKDILYSKSVNLLNNIILNFQADMRAKGEEVLEKARQKLKLSKNADKERICSFCGQKGAFSIARDRFFFAPSHFNAFWEDNPSIYACPYCIVCSFAIFESFTFLNSKNAIVIYKPNLKDLEQLNDIFLKKRLEKNNIVFGDVVKNIIEYEKLKLKKDLIHEEIQVIEFNLDSKNPSVEFYILIDKTIENLIAIEPQLKNLYENYRDDLYGSIKQGDGEYKIDLSKEIIKYISQNQKLIYLVQRYSRLGIRAEIYRQKEDKNPPIKGFSINVLLKILEMHFKLEVGMNYYEVSKEFGQLLRGKVKKKVTKVNEETQQETIDWNAFGNRIIQLANSFLDASKGNFQQFMETLSRVIISYDADIDNSLLKVLDKTNYKEIATTIALSLLVKKDKDERVNNSNNSNERTDAEATL